MTVHLPTFQSQIEKKMASLDKEVPIKVHVKQGDPIFTPKDICTTINPIARLARMFIVDNDVTTDEFDQCHSEYCKAQGMFPNMINTDKNNQKKAILKNRMSVTTFEKLTDILGFKIINLTYTLQDCKTGEIKNYSIADTEHYTRKPTKRDNLVPSDNSIQNKDEKKCTSYLRDKLS